MTQSLNQIFGRTLSSLSGEKLIVPHLEKAMVYADWPEEYPIKVYNKERVWDGYFHPSSDAALDELFLYYKFLHYRSGKLKFERLTPQLLMTFQVGSAYHSLVQSMMIHLEFTEEKYVEVPYVNEERWSSGTVDVQRFYVPRSQEVVPVEIKSAGFLPRDKPFQANEQQFQVYMDLCDPEHGPYERGVILYLEKSSPHRFKEFIVQRDEKLLRQTYEKWERVREAISLRDESDLVDCCTSNSSKHYECPARDVCRIGKPSVLR